MLGPRDVPARRFGMSLPVAFELIKKTLWTTDKKTGKRKQTSALTKNDCFGQMVLTCLENRLPLRYVLADLWVAWAENRLFVKQTHGKDFIFALNLCSQGEPQGCSLPGSAREGCVCAHVLVRVGSQPGS